MILYSKGKKLLLLSLLASSTAFSATETTTTALLSTLKQGHLAFEIGAYQGSQGRPQHINIQGLIGDTFSVDDYRYSSGLVGIGYFIDGKNLGPVNMSYGINAFYLAPTAVTGIVTQEDLFTNLSYHYNLIDYPIYAMAKATFNLTPPFALTVDAGIGPNIMKAVNFKEYSLDGGVTLPDNILSSNTQTKFSATVGASMKFDHVLGQLPLELGYRFFYLGQGHFNPANNQVLNNFNTGTTYANAIFLAISI